MTDLLLVDSSVWVELLRGRSSTVTAALKEAVTDKRVAICEPVAMELLAGATAIERSRIQVLVDGLPSLSVDPAVDFRMAAELSRQARVGGETVRSLIDCLIGAIALRHGAVVVHRDKDFDALSRFTEVTTQRWD